jgi:photosystem II stability/assembly factor-like uncharacterized protein
MADDDPKQNQVPSAPLGDMIAAVGRSVAEAQQALDAGSLATLREIHGQPSSPMLAELQQIGYRPTFYVIPKVESELTVAVSIEAKGGSLQLYVAPVDASYQSRYEYDPAAASKIRFSIVPVPPPIRAEQLRVVPELVGKSWVESEAMLARLELLAVASQEARPREQAVVESQSPAAGTLVDAGSTVTLGVSSAWVRAYAGTGEALYALEGDGLGSLWLVGRNGVGVESRDGGESWASMAMGVEESLFALVSTAEQTLIAAGASGTLLRRESTSREWTSSSAPLREDASVVAINGLAAREHRVVAVASHGQIVSSTDDGRSWVLASEKTTRNLHAVDGSSMGFFAVGEAGVILFSTDGVAWSPRNSGTTRNLYSVHFVHDSLAYAVGESGTILRWAGGSTWQSLPTATNENLYVVWSSAAGHVYAAGRKGALVRSTEGVFFGQVTIDSAEAIHAAWAGANDKADDKADDMMVLAGTNGLFMRFI